MTNNTAIRSHNRTHQLKLVHLNNTVFSCAAAVIQVYDFLAKH